MEPKEREKHTYSSVKRDAKSFYTREREQKSACTKYDKAWLYSIIMGDIQKNLTLGGHRL